MEDALTAVMPAEVIRQSSRAIKGITVEMNLRKTLTEVTLKFPVRGTLMLIKQPCISP